MHSPSLPIGTLSLSGRRFSLGAEERRRYCAIFGKSGTGKTTLLRNMVALDIHAGRGVSVLDPHGDLVRDIIEAGMIFKEPDQRGHLLQPAGLRCSGNQHA